MNAIEKIKSIEELSKVPDNQIQWMLDAGEIVSYEPGDFIFRPGEAADHLMMLLSGKAEVYTYQNNQKRTLGEFEAPYITGVLPFSRMEKAAGFGEILTNAEIFRIHRSTFPELVGKNYELTAGLVQSMTARVRNFTSMQLQNEKLMALGKISAGLAHELNNPSAAIVRSASELQNHLKLLPEGFKKVLLVKMPVDQVDKVNELLYEKILNFKGSDLPVMQRSEAEDVLAEWMEEHGVDDGYSLAPELVEYDFSTDDLQSILDACSEEDLPTIIHWVVNNLTTEKMVNDIQEASRRISELVNSVKSYTHMDQSQDKQAVDLSKSLRTTLTMLGHKLRKNKVEVEDSGLKPVPAIAGFPGQINQVFTNVIDNALDAMENGGRLILSSGDDGHCSWIKVMDTGMGIPPEVRERIFDPFYTTKDVGKGTGMGLEVVLKLMDLHKGKIELESEPGNTCFKLSFPIKN